MVHVLPRKVPTLVRPRPDGLSPYVKAKVCFQSGYCRSGSNCRFAHNSIEVKVWNLGVISYDDIVEKDDINNLKLPRVQSFVCGYCDKSFSDKWDIENHTNTLEHRGNINSDKERPWRYREPPGNVLTGKYELCPR